jgi:hypothetical protein
MMLSRSMKGKAIAFRIFLVIECFFNWLCSKCMEFSTI